jgi:hypothetical protein
MRPLLFVGALALALNLAVPAITAPICVPEPSHKVYAKTTADYGGLIEDYSKFVARTRRHHRLRPIRVEIRGECDSACVMKLAAPDVCVSRGTTIGVHEVRMVYDTCAGYPGSKRDDPGTAEYRASMPACAQRLFDSRNAFASNRITKFTGQEVLDACPQIKACK